MSPGFKSWQIVNILFWFIVLFTLKCSLITPPPLSPLFKFCWAWLWWRPLHPLFYLIVQLHGTWNASLVLYLHANTLKYLFRVICLELWEKLSLFGPAFPKACILQLFWHPWGYWGYFLAPLFTWAPIKKCFLKWHSSHRKT